MANKTDPVSPKTWVAIDVAKGINVALIEEADGRQQRWRFANCRDDYDRLTQRRLIAAWLRRVPNNGTANAQRSADSPL